MNPAFFRLLLCSWHLAFFFVCVYVSWALFKRAKGAAVVVTSTEILGTRYSVLGLVAAGALGFPEINMAQVRFPVLFRFGC
jgi:hypothetical protein